MIDIISFLIFIYLFTCVCVQFAVVRLFGGVEMLLDQERARHLAGGSDGRPARITVRREDAAGP